MIGEPWGRVRPAIFGNTPDLEQAPPVIGPLDWRRRCGPAQGHAASRMMERASDHYAQKR
jgi:hypothetical protein